MTTNEEYNKIKDLDITYKRLSKKSKHLEYDLECTKYEMEKLKKEIKQKCSHNSITHYIQPSWERSQHSYTCQICGFDLYSDEYDYKNIKKVVDM